PSPFPVADHFWCVDTAPKSPYAVPCRSKELALRRKDTSMQEDWETLAHVTAAELGFQAVRWWQDQQAPHLLRIAAWHAVGTERMPVLFTKLLPDFSPLLGTGSAAASRGWRS